MKSSWIIGALLLTLAITTAAGNVEPGLTVKTVFDLGKLGKHSANAYGLYPDPQGEYVLALDTTGNRILKLSLPLSQNSSLEFFAGSPQGESGYVDGPAARSLFDRPQSLTIGDNGAVFVADTKNFAIRKIDAGKVTTIAGGRSHKAGYADGPGDKALFSSEFTLAYVCGSLLVADRGNRLIREIKIEESCASGDSSVSGCPIWSVALVSTCLGLAFGALIMKELNQRRRDRATSGELLKACCRTLWKTTTTTTCTLGSRSELARAVSSVFLLLWCQLQLVGSRFFGHGQEEGLKRQAKQNDDLHVLLEHKSTYDFPDLIDFSSPPMQLKTSVEMDCLDKFLQEFHRKKC